jgi:hypothetical protein
MYAIDFANFPTFSVFSILFLFDFVFLSIGILYTSKYYFMYNI